MCIRDSNEQMKSEISVTRRATYKAEADIQQLEEKQKWQDLYIDGQHDKIKQLEEHLALLDAQYQSQQQETKAAADTLHEAAEEMQAINYEKRTPVSYTHLRAHETVLDLVCRLLLEKKKKKK
eukprot:TRINITY_DN4331_c0_g1_i2.p1 TRINITY_DN4331_c0_g1~~TRINITY_DN4331_c0_g1_i2.p1  ORF type:complete len:123 (+),score=69.35 TRINITY_DN4331_c0_g1_i2:106-474(+)